ncbi:hypothetical protein MCEMIE4_01080 [Sphingobium cupriresistens]
MTHAQIEHDRSDRCKARWKPLSENSRGFGPRRFRRYQRKQAFEHISQRVFTRKGDWQAGEIHLRSGGLNFADVRFGLSVF